MRQIFLDTETTGLSPDSGDRMVEIGCVEMDNRRLTGRHLHFYLNPQRKNGEGAVAVHGLTDEFLADKPLFATVADEILAFVAGAEVIIHNAAFDVGFLNEELRRLQRPRVETWAVRITDSLLLAREAFPGKSNSLDALCKRLEVDNAGRNLHGALLDAGLLAEVYIRLTRGQNTLSMEAGQHRSAEGLVLQPIDLASFDLPVIEPSAEEQAAHQAVLKDLDKASGGLALWRTALA